MPDYLGRFTRKTGEAAIRGHSLVMARWIAFTGQTLAVLVAYYLGFSFPVIPCLVCIAATGFLNNYASISDPHRNMVPERAFAYLSFDMLQLATLLYLTGGNENPFFVLLIAPVLIGATILSWRKLLVLLGLAIACMLYLSAFYLPLGWPKMAISHERALTVTEDIALGITIVFSSIYAWRISEERRSTQTAFFAARTALLKQKQIQAMGGVAAAAVHELGSPLGTIAIIAKELSNEIQKDEAQKKQYHEDIETLLGQTERCRKILAGFGKTLKEDSAFVSSPLPVSALLQNIADGFLSERPDIQFTAHLENGCPDISIPQRPELSYGLGVYIQNAIQLAHSGVSTYINTEKGLRIVIEDDGPGFSDKILARLGQPYTSTRIESGKNMGLGVFIAQTLLEDTGATITYENRNAGGAQISILWSESAFQSMLPAPQDHPTE